MPEERICRLDLPPLEHLPADLQERLAAYLEKPGFIPNVLRAYAIRPNKLRAFMDHYDELMLGDSELSKAEREMIAVAVSAQNHCFYCLTSHGAALRLRTKDAVVSDQIAANYRTAHLTPRQRAMLDFAYKITTNSATCGDEDVERLRAHGFSDAAIWDIAEIAGFFNFTNRLSNALDLRPNREYHFMGRDLGR
jgi:uncharacterized peroxidase-related enzyme